MGNRKVGRSRLVVKKEKDEAPQAPAPPDVDQEKDPNVLKEKLYRTRLELQKMLALSADADEIICRLTAEAHKVKQERDEEYMRHNALQAELQARRNAQVMMTAPTYGSPVAVFAGSGCYGNPALMVPALMVPAPSRQMTTQEQYYTRAAGVSYCFASSPPPHMFDSFVPAAATRIMPGTAGKKRSASELDLVVQQMLRLSRKKGEVLEAPVHEEDNDAVAGTTSNEETMSDAGLTEVGGDECSLADSAASKKQ
uniref:Uncharacterized protein n=1 Tax=Avena sativa TaxID=4498 RepID=A0ACD5VDG7_AVESA